MVGNMSPDYKQYRKRKKESDFVNYYNNRKERVNSCIILALDVLDYREGQKILNMLEGYLSAVKINYPFLLYSGANNIKKLIQSYDIPFIGDFKIADIDATNRKIADFMFRLGFHALIAHACIGYRGALDGLFSCAEKHGGGVILVTSMSHPGAQEFMPDKIELAKFADEIGADGIIAPATRPEEIKILRNVISGNMLIFTPGIGAQGGSAKEAMLSGSNGLIIGRTIYESKKPVETIKMILDNIGLYGEQG